MILSMSSWCYYSDEKSRSKLEKELNKAIQLLTNLTVQKNRLVKALERENYEICRTAPLLYQPIVEEVH